MIGLELNLANYDRDPVQAIQEFWMDLAENDYELSADDLAEAVVDARVARGDYEGCSTELELDHAQALAFYRVAVGGSR